MKKNKVLPGKGRLISNDAPMQMRPFRGGIFFVLCVCEIMCSMPLCLSSRGEGQNKVFRLSIDGSNLRLLPRTFFCADGKLSVFDVRYVKRTGSPKSIVLPDLDPSWDATQNQPQLQQQQQQQSQHQQKIKSTVKLMDILDRKIKKTNCSLVHSLKVFKTSAREYYPSSPQAFGVTFPIDILAILNQSMLLKKLTRIQY
jgi:hypothetical protein